MEEMYFHIYNQYTYQLLAHADLCFKRMHRVQKRMTINYIPIGIR